MRRTLMTIDRVVDVSACSFRCKEMAHRTGVHLYRVVFKSTPQGNQLLSSAKCIYRRIGAIAVRYRCMNRSIR